MTNFLFGAKKKEEVGLALDIGSEAVKAIIFQRFPGKITILGSSLRYFDEFLVFDSQDFERGVREKTIAKAIEEAGRETNKKPQTVCLGFSARILKGKVVSQSFKRENPRKIIDGKEERAVFQKALKRTEKDILQIYSKSSGILAQDIQFINLKILEIKIDGYRVPVLQRYEGENLDFRILAIFLLGCQSDPLRNFISNGARGVESIAQIKAANVKIVHEAEGLLYHLKDYSDGIFLDVGGEISQIFLLKAGKLEGISEFQIGGRVFSQAPSERLGLREQDSRIFKERYSKKELSQESLERVKEILHFPSQTWFRDLKRKLKEISYGRLLPSKIFLFGGGSQLSEIKEILKEGDWEDLSFVKKPEATFLSPKDFQNIEDKTKRLNSPQDVPALLLLSL